MKRVWIGIGIAGIAAAAGATAITLPSSFAGAFGSQHEDFVAPQSVNLNSVYIRKSISNISIESAMIRLDRQHRGENAGFSRRSSVMEPIEGLHLLSSSTRVVNEDTVEMKVSFNGEAVSTLEVHIAAITESHSTVDVQVRFDYDWLSDSGEVLPGDLARLEPMFEILATEYVMSVLQRRPYARSDDEFAQIYGQDTLDRIEERVGRSSRVTRRVEAAVEAQLSKPAQGYEASNNSPQKPGELPRRFRPIQSETYGPRVKPGEGFHQPEDDDEGSNWGTN